MTDTETMPAEIDSSATYLHFQSGLIGHVEDWAREPDDSLKIRIKDHWVMFADCKRADEAETTESPD